MQQQHRSGLQPLSYGRQSISDEDIQTVVDVLRSDFLTQGPAISLFERALVKETMAQEAVALSSATAALHLLYLALGLSKGDMVWTSPITFVATANAARYCGASVDFVDVDKSTGNICPLALETKLDIAKGKNQLPKILTVVHLGGLSCDMANIGEMCKRYGVLVVEDASHALGGTYEGSPIGSCRYSVASVFSFHPVKMITTCEGGAVTTNDHKLAQKIRLLGSHGITRDSKLFEHETDGPWYYEQIELGFNYRLSDVHAALGVSQIKRLSSFVTERDRLANYYKKTLGEELNYQLIPSNKTSSFHLFMVQFPSQKYRDNCYQALLDNNITAQVHYIPVYRHPYYRSGIQKPYSFLNSEYFYAHSLSLPLFAGLTIQSIDRVCRIVERVLKK